MYLTYSIASVFNLQYVYFFYVADCKLTRSGNEPLTSIEKDTDSRNHHVSTNSFFKAESIPISLIILRAILSLHKYIALFS